MTSTICRTAALLSAALSLSACTIPLGPTRPVITIAAPFDAAAARKLIDQGPNTVRGNAFLRQQGGGVVTCAGAKVHLTPATAYAEARMSAIYGTTQGPAVARPPFPLFEPDVPEYTGIARTTQCDSGGRFNFDGVADGEFFIVTAVVWQVGYATQGGAVMRRIAVTNGQTVEVVISP